jgi:uncharacterized SAM-dependent methyltransferase
VTEKMKVKVIKMNFYFQTEIEIKIVIEMVTKNRLKKVIESLMKKDLEKVKMIYYLIKKEIMIQMVFQKVN